MNETTHHIVVRSSFTFEERELRALEHLLGYSHESILQALRTITPRTCKEDGAALLEVFRVIQAAAGPAIREIDELRNLVGKRRQEQAQERHLQRIARELTENGAPDA